MYIREEMKRRENERGMARRPEMPLPHGISSWGGGGAVGVLYYQEEPQPSQHVPAQSGATISHPTQEQVKLRRGVHFLGLWQGWLTMPYAANSLCYTAVLDFY